MTRGKAFILLNIQSKLTKINDKILRLRKIRTIINVV